MQSVDFLQLSDLDRTLSDLLQEFPEMRRELHEELGELAKQDVDAAIAASGVQDGSGKVRRWQVVHVGSGGGYAAVHPANAREGGSTGPNSAGAITNYLDSGHKIRGSKGGKAYRPRIKIPHVNGNHFYQTAKTSFEAKAIKKAEEFANRLAERLEGGR